MIRALIRDLPFPDYLAVEALSPSGAAGGTVLSAAEAQMVEAGNHA